MEYGVSKNLLFLVISFMLVGCATNASVYGLKPEYPEARHGFFTETIAFVEVDSLQPTLKWESFHLPWLNNLTDENPVSELCNITYELKIWRAGARDQPVDLIYERRGLPEPFHKIERTLDPSARYLWTIRAKFEINGKPRVSTWGRTKFNELGNLDIIPSLNFYRFETPASRGLDHF